uniref:Secreted protein n=1 Tax=Ixodes scapularis TaxID=6945 RepID=A0A4D5RX87_IXOSC
MACPRCSRFLIGAATITVFRSLLVTDCGTSASCAIDVVLLFSTIRENKIMQQTTINMLVCPMNPLVSGNLSAVSSKFAGVAKKKSL